MPALPPSPGGCSAPPGLALPWGGGIRHLLLTLTGLVTAPGPSWGTNKRFNQLSGTKHEGWDPDIVSINREMPSVSISPTYPCLIPSSPGNSVTQRYIEKCPTPFLPTTGKLQTGNFIPPAPFLPTDHPTYHWQQSNLQQHLQNPQIQLH